ncbi:hypothetical protein EYF80_025681 [Liparis tanakae]|uniref:Uncharacterized protein n=1 Tax=Liparis tanakae TaxID=230148 RepID=A0A4Z2HGH3_9TELE|nr:hypothetical protein EYF80_025681 [Liparis tanakae]
MKSDSFYCVLLLLLLWCSHLSDSTLPTLKIESAPPEAAEAGAEAAAPLPTEAAPLPMAAEGQPMAAEVPAVAEGEEGRPCSSGEVLLGGPRREQQGGPGKENLEGRSVLQNTKGQAVTFPTTRGGRHTCFERRGNPETS